MVQKNRPSTKKKERRASDVRCTRVSIMTRLILESEGGPGRIEAYSHNVSYRGIGFYSVKSLPVGRTIAIKVCYSPDDDLNFTETVWGEVRWCKRIGKWYGAGVEFKELTPEKQPLLFSYVQSALQFHHIHPHPEDEFH